jgi:hypothetical protein
VEHECGVNPVDEAVVAEEKYHKKLHVARVMTIGDNKL